MNRFALAAAALLFSTVCIAQQPTTMVNSPAAANARTGEFRPAQSNDLGRGDPAPSDPAAQATGVAAIPKEYRVGPNDLLDVEVLNLESGRRTVRVNAGGYISMPLIGSVAVAGLTQQQVETHIAGLYGEKYLQDPQVSVFIKEFTTERISIDGAVTKPGIYPLVGQMTLLRALALAGGFGQLANAKEVKIFRQGEAGQRQVATFNVEQIRAGTEPDPAVRGDDLIVVQRDSTRALLKDSVFRDIVDSINPFAIFR